MSAKSRYEKLTTDRSSYTDRARNCAKVTIPHLFPPDGSSGSTKLDQPEQGIGARGVNNVAAKITQALFPPNAPFFKMEIDELVAKQMTQQDGLKDQIDAALGQYVRRVMADFEKRALRADLYEVCRQLVVAGNATLYVSETGRCRVYRLDNYVCKRDPTGHLLEWIGIDKIARAALPDDIRNKVPAQQNTNNQQSNGVQTAPADGMVDLYTHVLLREDGQYTVYQEVLDQVVKGSEGSFKADELPFLVLRFNAVSGEDYGRSLVEDYLGDLITLENLSKNVREFTAIASRVIPLVSPNGLLKPSALTKAENGEPILGNEGDLHFVQIERYNDFRVQKELIDKIEQRLAFAFLLNTAIQRNGERVTAEEIRYMAKELEDTLGGTYSVQAVDFQLPLANALIKQLESQKQLPELPPQAANPKVVTGMDALGRGFDLSNLLQFVQLVSNTPAADQIKWDSLARRIGNSLNIEMDGLLKTPEEAAAEQQEAAQQQMMASAVPNAVNQIGAIAQKTMDGKNTND